MIELDEMIANMNRSERRAFLRLVKQGKEPWADKTNGKRVPPEVENARSAKIELGLSTPQTGTPTPSRVSPQGGK